MAFQFTACASSTQNSAPAAQSEVETPRSMTAEQQPTVLEYYPPQYNGMALLPPNDTYYQNKYRYESGTGKESWIIESFNLKTGETGYLCEKEGCAHSDETCNAYRTRWVNTFVPMKDALMMIQVLSHSNTAEVFLSLIDYNTAEIKKIPLQMPFIDFAYNNIEMMWGSGFVADENNIYCALVAQQLEIGADDMLGNLLQTKYYLTRIDRETGACEMLQSSDYYYSVMGALGNSLVITRDLGKRSGMETDPNDPNTPFFEIITLPLDGTPETIHHTAPMRSESYLYHKDTHAFYYGPMTVKGNQNEPNGSEGKIYKQDLLTGQTTLFAQIPPTEKDTAFNLNLSFASEDYLLVRQSGYEESRQYRVSLTDGTVQERAATISPQDERSFAIPYTSVGDQYLIMIYNGCYWISKADYWAGNPNYTEQQGLWKFQNS